MRSSCINIQRGIVLVREILICTVGTSLLTNRNRENFKELQKYIEKKNVQGVVESLLEIDSSQRGCGAEINSINSLIKKGEIGKRNWCIFLVSDSPEGEFVGSVLERYFDSSKNRLRFENTDTVVIKGLTDTDINRFRSVGLRNLVKETGKIAKKYGASKILINATGGYKAQISFAGMIGQALGIPVAYMHERFNECIILPPQPVNLDMNFWLQYGEDFFALNNGTSERESYYLNKDVRFGPLIESIDIDGEILTSLTATGQLFHETFSVNFLQREEEFLPEKCKIIPENKKVRYEDSNSGKHKGLKEFIGKIIKEPFVVSVASSYYNRDLSKKITFRISSKCNQNQIEGVYSSFGKTTNVFITTTSESENQRKACCNYLLQKAETGFY